MNETMGTGDKKDFFELVKKPITKYHYQIYIKDSIRETDNLCTLINLLRSASKGDQITIYINSSGGWLNTTQQILNAMEDCDAEITTIADGRVASAATLIFMAGANRIIKDNSTFMFHNYSAGVNGKGHEMFQKITFQHQYYPELMKKYYKDFFNEEEILEIVEGKDVWMSGKEVQAKLDKLKKQQENEGKKKNERSSRTSKKTS